LHPFQVSKTLGEDPDNGITDEEPVDLITETYHKVERKNRIVAGLGIYVTLNVKASSFLKISISSSSELTFTQKSVDQTPQQASLNHNQILIVIDKQMEYIGSYI
jgi:hypothetical protein